MGLGTEGIAKCRDLGDKGTAYRFRGINVAAGNIME